MLILGCDNKLYLLLHLSSFKKNVGQKVYIGDVVAEVGNTGYSNGAHLHLQMFLTDYSPEDFINIMEFEKKKNEKTKDSKIQCADRNIVNPFDYTEKYEKDTKK